MKGAIVFAFAFLGVLAFAAEPNPPTWDAKWVKLIDPEDPSAGQSAINEVWFENGGQDPPCHGQFSASRYALLMKPGYHDVDLNVGYYTQVIGLGRKPTDTRVRNFWSINGDRDPAVGALNNFWRGVENLQLSNQQGPVTWAVSQASPMRRMHIEGDINLFDVTYPNTAAGAASGGYMSDSVVTGNIFSGSQQQWFSRNVDMTKWNNGVWNIVFLGCPNAPASHCSNENGDIPTTTIDKTPLIAEKPYIVMDGDSYKLMIPNYETDKVGATPGWQNAQEVDFAQVYVASSIDSSEKINAKLEEGLHIVLQPGMYQLTDSLKVNKPGTVILGIGLATLVATTGQPAIEVANVDNVRIAGLTLEAGHLRSESLLKWGSGNYVASPEKPGVISDVFARVGGPTDSQVEEVTAESMVEVNSDNVLIDHVWLWRADHDVGGLVYSGKDYVASSLVVNGNNVRAYGLFGEHTLGNIIQWNGENGETYFYQSELPYDVTQEFAEAGFASYAVADHVKNHKGYGLGVYSFFRDYEVIMPTGIRAPYTEGVHFRNSISVFLNGKGGIQHVVNDQGGEVNKDKQTAYLCEYGPSAQMSFLK